MYIYIYIYIYIYNQFGFRADYLGRLFASLPDDLEEAIRVACFAVKIEQL